MNIGALLSRSLSLYLPQAAKWICGHSMARHRCILHIYTQYMYARSTHYGMYLYLYVIRRIYMYYVNVRADITKPISLFHHTAQRATYVNLVLCPIKFVVVFFLLPFLSIFPRHPVLGQELAGPPFIPGQARKQGSTTRTAIRFPDMDVAVRVGGRVDLGGALTGPHSFLLRV